MFHLHRKRSQLGTVRKSCIKCGSRKHHQSMCPELHNNPSPRKPQEKSTPTTSGINARRMELQQLRPMPRVQTRNAAFYYKRPVPSPRMKKERNQLPSGYYSLGKVKGRTLPKIYVPDYSLNLFKIRS